jgi:cytochrome c biogenesis protein CcmG/thiol:disulfide interchange protein DsbE
VAPGLTPARRGLVGPFTGRQLAAMAISVVAAALVLVVLTRPISPAGTVLPRAGDTFVPVAEPTEGLQVGQRAPEFAGQVEGRPVELVDLDGLPLRLADLRGRPVWINFFATWCPPCQSETPIIQRVHEKHRAEGLAVVAVSVQESSPEDVRRYAQTYGLTYTIGFDATAAVFKTYQAYGLPTQLFLDRDGVVRFVWRGPLTEAEVEQILAPLLVS